MLWHGRIFDPQDKTPATDSIRTLTQMLTRSSYWIASLVPARDGVIIAYKMVSRADTAGLSARI